MKNAAYGFRYQKGLAAVEFTMLVPLLLFLFIATAEIGRLLYDYNTLTKAQRNGVRFLASHATTGQTNSIPDVYVDQATNLVVFGEITDTDGNGDAREPLLEGLTVAGVTFDAPDNDQVRVTVSYNYTPMVFDSIPTFGLTNPIPLGWTLSSSVTVRALLGG